MYVLPDLVSAIEEIDSDTTFSEEDKLKKKQAVQVL